MDKRLLEALVEYLRKKGLLGHCYDPARAGAVKDLVVGGAAAESVWKDIEIGIDKGGVGQIVLCNHTDCAAYGGNSRFSSFQEERDFHIREMEKAKDLIRTRFPGLKVSLVLAKIDPSGSVDFEEIADLVTA